MYEPVSSFNHESDTARIASLKERVVYSNSTSRSSIPDSDIFIGSGASEHIVGEFKFVSKVEAGIQFLSMWQMAPLLSRI